MGKGKRPGIICACRRQIPQRNIAQPPRALRLRRIFKPRGSMAVIRGLPKPLKLGAKILPKRISRRMDGIGIHLIHLITDQRL